MDLKLIVFDVDGTLVDSQDHITDAMTAAFAAAAHPAPAREAILSIVGLSLPVAVRVLAPSLPDTEIDLIVAHYKTGFMQRRSHSAPALYPGARDVLDRLHAAPDHLLGIATGKSRRGLDHLIAAHGLDGVFITRQVADDHPSKPHPSMLMATLRDTGLQAGQGAMIGDTTYDIAMGRAAGFRTIGVTWGYHGSQMLRDAGADVLIDSFAELSDVLDGMWEY
ncbi:HAD-IA family hydrolase [Plastorhodobacter daqingensis]|uniref:HAD-IA family hydrolase n=1 Tax=Plastorhodobacter daqingensis TaxID=1387281 RepID=A0ABW2UEB7_9RHOB